MKHTLETDVIGLTRRLGDGGSKGEGSKVILRDLVLVTMWMTVLCDTGKTRFGMTGKQKFSFCHVRFGIFTGDLDKSNFNSVVRRETRLV